MSPDGLIEMPPVSNVMPLPTSTIGFCLRCDCSYSRTMNRGGSSLPLVTDRNEPMPSASISGALHDGDLDRRKRLAELLRALGEIARRAHVPRQVAEILGEIHPVRDRKAARRGRLAGPEIRALRHRQRQFAQRPPHFGGLALHLLEPVDRVHRHDNRVLDPPGHFPALDLFLGQVQNRLVGARFVQQLDRAADGLPEFLVAKIALLAEPEQEDAIGKRSAHAMQQQRGAELPLHVAPADDFADIAVRRTIDQFRGQGELAVIENADDDACAALLLGASAFYGKFHRAPRVRLRAFLCDRVDTRALSANRRKKVKIFPPS